MQDDMKQRPLSIILSSIAMGSLLLVLAGCGGSPDSGRIMGAVEITVTFDGQPVTDGTVQMIVPGEGKAAGGDLDSEGKISLEEVEIGRYTVFVTPPSEPPPEADKKSLPPKAYDNIPKKFRSESTSPLNAEVKKGTNEFSFELKE